MTENLDGITGRIQPGKFITFEGGEGTGKSTQARILAETLDAVHTYEPGHTAVGKKLREILLDPSTENLAISTEALLMAADRAQHVYEVIRPNLAVGRSVVCDRYIGSTIAYQGYGRGLDTEELYKISEFASGCLYPDLVIWLEVPEEESARRLRACGKPDRMESESRGFHRDVRRGFHEQAANDPNWVYVDGMGSIEEISERILEVVRSCWGNELLD